ncbi:hypothetical protein ACWEIJ_35410 [Lentzea sp. NPDC004789]
MITRLAVATGTAAVALAALAGTASAGPAATRTLAPGQQWCISQYASYQVRGDGSATAQGAKFKLQYNGVTAPGTGSPALVNYWAAELRTSNGTFLGPGYYSACATNNGTTNTTVKLQIRTDGEFL